VSEKAKLNGEKTCRNGSMIQPELTNELCRLNGIRMKIPLYPSFVEGEFSMKKGSNSLILITPTGK